MAKTGIWLRGASGKLGGNVLFKGENATIIRENKTPRNPQSAKQMLQRVAFATVSQAAKFMLPVIGQTFQGAGDEKKNRREFFRNNVTRLKKAFDRYNGISSGQPMFPDYTAANPKGVAMLIPNRYVMSRGQLSLPSWLQPKMTFNPLTQEGSFNSTALLPTGELKVNIGEALNPLTLLTAMTGLKLGQQLTFSAINTVDGTNVNDFQEEYPDLVRYSNFLSKRLVIIDDEDVAAEASVNITAETTFVQIRSALMALIDRSKSDPNIVDFFESNVASMFEISAAAEGATNRTITYGQTADTEEQDRDIINKIAVQDIFNNEGVTHLVGFSVILSELIANTWAYSNSEMVIMPKTGDVAVSNDKYYGFDYANAWKTYVKSTAVTSDLFTRRGGKDNSIE